MRVMHPDTMTKRDPLSPGHVFLHLVLVLAVLLSAAAGILNVMRDTGRKIPLLQPGGEKPPVATPVAGQDVSEDGQQEDAATIPAEEKAGTEASASASDAVSAAGEDTAKRGHAETKTGAKTTVNITFADAVLSNRLEGITVFLREGHDNPEGSIVCEGKTDHIGQVTLSVPDGAYTLDWEAEGFVEDYDNLTVGNGDERQEYYRDSVTDYVFWKSILPAAEEKVRYIVMEWKSKEDLDLCVFNAKTKEFISIIAPMDSDGNFLYLDDYDGSPGMEIVRINDALQAAVYAPYVRDGKSLRRGSYSAMEATGVRVSIYSGIRLLSRREAAGSERAGLWNPCYIYEGNVYEEGAYIYDPAKYMWAAFEKPSF